MAQRFDPSRDYGEVCGDASGAKYEQDGILYNALGEPVGGQVVDAPVQRRAPRAKKSVEAALDDQLAANLAEVVGGLEN